jgi:hypothetical protein
VAATRRLSRAPSRRTGDFPWKPRREFALERFTDPLGRRKLQGTSLSTVDREICLGRLRPLPIATAVQIVRRESACALSTDPRGRARKAGWDIAKGQVEAGGGRMRKQAVALGVGQAGGAMRGRPPDRDGGPLDGNMMTGRQSPRRKGETPPSRIQAPHLGASYPSRVSYASKSGECPHYCQYRTGTHIPLLKRSLEATRLLTWPPLIAGSSAGRSRNLRDILRRRSPRRSRTRLILVVVATKLAPKVFGGRKKLVEPIDDHTPSDDDCSWQCRRKRVSRVRYNLHATSPAARSRSLRGATRAVI